MLVRIVKMKFREESVAGFLAFFEERKSIIRGFDGCLHLELWRDAADPCLFFTYSHWRSEADLNHYRFSEFFKETWQYTRAQFAAPAEAWSLQQTVVMP